MNVLMVASEATPFAKTGGLADVIGGLPPALAAKGRKRRGGDSRLSRERLSEPAHRGVSQSLDTDWSRFHDGPLSDHRARRHVLLRTLSDVVRPRRHLFFRRHRSSGQPHPFRGSLHGRARGGAVSVHSEHYPLARLAGGAGAGLSQRAFQIRPDFHRHQDTLYHSQSRISGHFCPASAFGNRIGPPAVQPRTNWSFSASSTF